MSNLYPIESLKFGVLTMQASSNIDYEDILSLETGALHLKYAATIKANRIVLKTGSMLMEGEATLDISGKV